MLVYIIIIIIGIYLYRTNTKRIKNSNLKEIPLVKGCVPLFGHIFSFSNHKRIKFLKSAYENNGKIFRIKLFSKEIVVICDREMISMSIVIVKRKIYHFMNI